MSYNGVDLANPFDVNIGNGVDVTINSPGKDKDNGGKRKSKTKRIHDLP